ncbi:helix-turn-helix domain-containing protein, partial [Limosilactobacillus reuteri]|uniref:helix-turn-helix domain-containing protein n=1 Tax=Limosilactobacillus reuteri TaxID=1598 RepID=UPI003D0520AF
GETILNQEQTNITTGKQIRHLRTQLGMTQEELAGELNVTRQALSNWERDVNEPDLNMWQIAINKLNTSSKHFSHKDFNG